MTAVKPSLTQTLSNLKPNPKQREFLLAREANVLYGGARGGGKSWCMRMKLLLMSLKYSDLSCLLLRRTNEELEGNHMLPLMRLTSGYAKCLTSKKRFEFPNGSVLKLGYCDNDKDATHYQGHEYDIIAIDEATQFKGEWVTTIGGSLRTVRTDISPQMLFTANPGGVGHAYFKRLFVDRDFHAGEEPGDYRFISATVNDNDILRENDPGYVRRLERLPDARRKAWLEGSWDVFEGQVFANFRDNAAGYYDGKNTHVINGFMPGDGWRLYMSYDFGSNKPYSFGWYGADGDGTVYAIAELYGWNGNANEGNGDDSETQFRKAMEFERSHPYLRGRKIKRIADPSIFNRGTGDVIADVAARAGLRFYKGINSRVSGLDQVQRRLQFDDNGRPRLYIFRECEQLIRTLPTLVYDSRRPEDIDSGGEDHAYDQLRYFLMEHPMGKIEENEESLFGG